ncbi:hypothetical protein BD779DRAFT_1784919 [Infundibulicybe gibba]|nr:hypothetical protein BD779DRAFT_1784919 [Infundibulicybe gibba]
MSRQQQDGETHPRSRQRANTTSFAPFAWRRRTEQLLTPPLPASPPVHSLPMDALIEALTPPAVPSLGYARSLASALSSQSPLPRLAALSPVLASLCDIESPVSLQAAGYDILSAYWENNDAASLGTADRLSYFAIFLGSGLPWATELWEPRFKALRALTKWGIEIVGIETAFLDLLKSWIDGAFDSLLNSETPAERAERERSVDVLAQFLTSIPGDPATIARIPEEQLAGILQFYASLVDRSIFLPVPRGFSPIVDSNSSASTPSRSSLSHRRNPSSLSAASIPSPTSGIVTPKSFNKHPADIAITLYLNHLSAQLKTLSPTYLHNILPLLFRALAFHSSPLPRLNVTPLSSSKDSTEDKITETLTSLFAGPYSATCMMILKEHLSAPIVESESTQESNVTPPKTTQCSIQSTMQTSLGAHRTLRNYIRRALSTRLARAYISREASIGYSHSGAPGHMDMERDLMERAWPKEDYSTTSGGNGWDAGRLGRLLSDSVKSWVTWDPDLDKGDEEERDREKEGELKESILEEAGGVLKDVFQELDAREDENGELDEEEAAAVGEILFNLTQYVIPLKNPDGTPFVIPLTQAAEASTSFLRTLSSLLSRDHTISLSPLLSTTLLSVAKNLTDVDTARLPYVMFEQHDLSPTSPDWLDNWQNLLGNPTLVGPQRPLTRRAIMNTLHNIYESVRDMVNYRRPLADIVLDLGENWGWNGDGDGDGDLIWKLLGDEAVLRTVENGTDGVPIRFVNLLSAVASDVSISEDDEENDTASVLTTDTQAPSPHLVMNSPSTLVSPILSRVQSEYHGYGKDKDKDLGLPSVMSILSSLTSGNSSRSQSLQPQMADQRVSLSQEPTNPENPSLHRAVAAVSSLISIFTQLTFSTFALESKNLDTVLTIYRVLLKVLLEGKSTRARITVLQFMMRLRADRDHRLYLRHVGYDAEGQVVMLSSLIHRTSEAPVAPTTEGILSYDPDGPGLPQVLPISDYLDVIITILERERNWEVLSYVLCHLPIQLANKHLFCGPKSREAIARLLSLLCTGVLNGELGLQVDRWPRGLKARDAQGLAYHILSVLISYRRCFELPQRHLLVEVFQAGLDGQPSTIKCCLHALSLSAFELQPSMTKCLPRILEKLSQIMSNPDMVVHILGFLSIIGSLPTLYSNFTEGDFKMVFGVALQYLQHYNRANSSSTLSWALSQHVRILSYNVVYIWFLAVRLSDRPRHVSYITRQLLLANEGNTQVDGPTEVCFDWLARYTYASADPRPANSLFSDIITNPTIKDTSEVSVSEKTWFLGSSVVTFRALARLGWVEVLTRRPSGFSRFLCRIENAPMVGPGDVDPDLLSIPASLLMERDPPRPQPPTPQEGPETKADELSNVQQILADGHNENQKTPPPDPITGYVWSGSAPSQRRKEVVVGPSYLALQLSSYPHESLPSARIMVDSPALPKFFASLDRMPVIDTHKVGVMYVAPGQSNEIDILRNTHGSPAYTRFLEGIGRLINLRGQYDVYAGGLDPGEDGEYAYAWWDDIRQVLYHTATMMPTTPDDPHFNNKKRHIGNDYVRIVWNDSGKPYRFDTLSTQFQFVNIVIEPHSLGAIAAFSNNLHENEYFKVTVQRAPGMTEFAPVGSYKLISAENLPLLVRQLSLLADWFTFVFAQTQNDTAHVEVKTNWHTRWEAIRRFQNQIPKPDIPEPMDGVMSQELQLYQIPIDLQLVLQVG